MIYTATLIDLEFHSLVEYIICIYITLLLNQIIILTYTSISSFRKSKQLVSNCIFQLYTLTSLFYAAKTHSTDSYVNNVIALNPSNQKQKKKPRQKSPNHRP